MTLSEARKIAYDIKARHMDTLRQTPDERAEAIRVLCAGRAVKHRRDNDRRLAETIKRFIS